MPLPPDILRAISNPHGGRLVLVIGAGTSVEPPTKLKLAAAYAQEAHRKLLADNILDEPCDDPNDLSLVADQVYNATNSQIELVRRLPRSEFQQASPNNGHLLAAVLLFEGAIRDILSLNYDCAMANALSQIGCRGSVSIIDGPENCDEIGHRNLIYLHRSANSDPDDWIIRSADLERAWQDGWEQVITNMVLTSPVVVFIGLGSPAAVLTESSQRIRSALDDSISVYYVSPGDPSGSDFFINLRLHENASISMGWVDFMQELSERLVEEYRNDLACACEELAQNLGLEEDGAVIVCNRLSNLGLLGLGKLRAAWLLDDDPYLVNNNDRIHWMADLILAITQIEQEGNYEAYFHTDGIVEFWEGGRMLAAILLAHGRGIDRWSTVEEKIVRKNAYWANRFPRPQTVLISGVPDGRNTDTHLPIDIIKEMPVDSIISGPGRIPLISVDELRGDPELIRELFSR